MHTTFMQRAVELSGLAYQSGKGLPIGCVIVRNGAIVGEGHNEIFARCNPTAHAEMVAIEDACKRTSSLRLEGCDLYTSLEPCPMCLAAVYWARVRTVYFANSTRDAIAAGFDDSFILRELTSPPEQRRIQSIATPSDDALRVLHEWRERQLPASQPWTDDDTPR
jgi:tRNA(Arg) A34 adenosine deaminase TadA